MGIGQSWATPENAPPVEPSLHISNTRNRGKAIDFWMFAPPCSKQKPGIVCGVCKTEIPEGEKHCSHCWGKED